MSFTFVISGGTGYIGKNFINSVLKNSGTKNIVVITRNRKKAQEKLEKSGINQEKIALVEWREIIDESTRNIAEEIKGLKGQKTVFLNLAGENIGQRWSKKRKEEILSSRVISTRKMVELAEEVRPDIFISASAIGFYGDTGEKEVDERSPQGSGFLSEVCARWEEEAAKSTNSGAKTFILRIGVVIGKDSGFIRSLITPLFVANPFSGEGVFISWIHINDLVRIIKQISDGTLAGDKDKKKVIVNAVSPNPAEAREIVRVISKITKKPAVPVPKFLIGIMMGWDFVKESFVSQKVKPFFLIENRFDFAYPDIGKALDFLR